MQIRVCEITRNMIHEEMSHDCRHQRFFMREHNSKTLLSLCFLIVFITAFITFPAIAGTVSDSTKYSGMCDASASVPVGSSMFVVANDEDNLLRVYSRNTRSSKPLAYRLDMKAAPGCPDMECLFKVSKKHKEVDIEGATLIGNRIFWISSHGTNKEGKSRPNRRRLFATDVQVNDDKVTMTPVGTPYMNLIADLSIAPQLKDLQLDKAAEISPEDEGGLNIEGLTRTPQGTLLIAFRNPIPNKKALLVPLVNPQEIIDWKSAKFGEPILLSLGGLGIRSIEYSEARSSYLIIAGSYSNIDDFKLYEWSGDSNNEPLWLEGVDFKGLHPEALIIYPGEKNKIQILSDDGDENIDELKCKDEEVSPEKKSFRSVWVTLE